MLHSHDENRRAAWRAIIGYGALALACGLFVFGMIMAGGR